MATKKQDHGPKFQKAVKQIKDASSIGGRASMSNFKDAPPAKPKIWRASENKKKKRRTI